MRTALAFCLLLGSAALAQEPKRPDAQGELKKLEGVWEGFAVEGKGERPNQGPLHMRLTIKGDKMTGFDIRGNREMGTGTFKIDLSNPVKQMDAAGVVLPGKKDRTYRGIYELDGDTLKWCVDNRLMAHPTEFRTNNGSYLMILKRKK